jgi:hypothetical protein
MTIVRELHQEQGGSTDRADEVADNGAMTTILVSSQFDTRDCSPTLEQQRGYTRLHRN